MTQLDDITNIFVGIAIKNITEIETPNFIEAYSIEGEHLVDEITCKAPKMTPKWVHSKESGKFIQKGDIVIQTRGTFKATLIDFETKKLNIIVDQNFVVVKANNEYVIPEVLCFIFNSQKFHEQVLTKTRKNKYKITKKQIASLQLDLPSLDIQQALKNVCLSTFKLKIDSLRLLEKQVELSEVSLFEHANLEYSHEQ